jgi:hypothetical protein
MDLLLGVHAVLPLIISEDLFHISFSVSMFRKPLRGLSASPSRTSSLLSCLEKFLRVLFHFPFYVFSSQYVLNALFLTLVCFSL